MRMPGYLIPMMTMLYLHAYNAIISYRYHLTSYLPFLTNVLIPLNGLYPMSFTTLSCSTRSPLKLCCPIWNSTLNVGEGMGVSSPL